MIKKITISALLIIVAILFWFLDTQFNEFYLIKGFYTFLSIFILYVFFKVIMEEGLSKGISDPKMKYSFNKIVSIMFMLILAVVLVAIWVEDPSALFLAYGLIGAGIAISLQDVFKNFAGGIIILVNNLYKVGDRIEIDSKVGDVIDIDILYTTIMEVKGWVAAEQPSGRLVMIPNGSILGGSIHNYTKDHNFIWDEIILPITFDSDWRYAHDVFLELLKTETEEMVGLAEKDISKLEKKYYLTRKVTEPAIYIKITDNWIEFYIRFVSEIRQRRLFKDTLSRKILEVIEKSDNKIKLASATFDIVGFPEVRVKQVN